MQYYTHLLGLCMLLISINNCIAQNKLVTNNKHVEIAQNVISLNMNDSILLYVNQYRRNKKLSALQLDSVIAIVALGHSINMATKKVAFGHDGFEERIQRIIRENLKIKASAENVAFGNLSAKGVVKGWMNSPRHLKNIEGNYTYTGIGVVKDDKGISFFTQIFIR